MRLVVQLAPNAAADRVIGLAVGADGAPALKIAVRARPHDGAANAALIRFLARALDLPPRAVSLLHGAASRRKLVHVAGDPRRLEPHFEEAFAPWLRQ